MELHIISGMKFLPSGRNSVRLFGRAPLLLLIATIIPVCSQAESIADYEEARRVFWDSLYSGGGQTLYCGKQFAGGQRRGLNVEHVFPMSWVTNALDCGTRNQCRDRSELFNSIEADLHNLYPARQEINEECSSFRYAEISGELRRFGDCDFEVDYQAREAEPSEASRGEIARAMFYMENRYHDAGLEIFSGQARMLRQWHRDDPPGAAEIERNDRIEGLQGNRNPYIDTPALLYDDN